MSTLFTDSMTRANGAIGANYTIQTGHSGTWNIASNVAVVSSLAGDTATAITAVTFPNNQWVQATVDTQGAGGGAGYGISVRMDTTTVTEYRLVGGDSGAAGCTELAKEVAGVFTSLATSTDSWDPGAVMYLEIQGNVLIAKKNGTTLFGGSVTDTVAIVSGRAGLIYSSTASAGGLTNLTAGDFAGGTTYTLAVANASLPVSGKTIAFPRAIKAAITKLNVPITGQAVHALHKLGVGVLSVPVVGQAVTLTYSGHTNYSLTVAKLNVPIIGQAVHALHKLGVTVASVPIAGQSITLTYTVGPRTLTLPVGTATVPIVTAPVFVDYGLPITKLTVPATPQAVILTYTPVGTHSYVLGVSSRSIPIAGQTVNFKSAHTLAITSRSVPVAMQNVNLIYSPPLAPIVCAGGSFDSLTPMPGLTL